MGHDNIALIRSGQDWADAEADERSLYLDEILPTLQDGMDFLRDNGAPWAATAIDSCAISTSTATSST